MGDPWCAVAQVESNWKYASSRGGQGAGEEGLYMCFVRPWQDDALISWVDVFKATMFVAVGRRVQATCAAIASLRHSAFSSKRARACLFCSCRRCNSSRSLPRLATRRRCCSARLASGVCRRIHVSTGNTDCIS